MKGFERLSLRLYRTLARAFPAEFRHAHGSETLQVTEDLIRDVARRQGLAGLIPAVLRMLSDLLVRLAVEHLSGLAQDTRYGARMLARSPGFTLAAVVCLAIGIGEAASVFSQYQSTVLRPVPMVREPERLVKLAALVSLPDYEHFRDDSGQFTSLAAFLGPVPLVVALGAQPERVWGHLVTPDYFAVLGVDAAAGRTFGAEERRPGSPPVAVISERFWQARFGGEPGVVGRSVRINGQPVTVIGIAPKDFLGASPMLAAADLWLPTTLDARTAPELARDRLEHLALFQAVGRLKPGVAREQAEAALDTLARGLEQTRNDPGKDRKGRRVTLMPGGRLFPIRDQDVPALMGFPLVLIGLILWIACASVATMLVARGIARRKEIAVRLAMGASRGRIVRQLLAESMLLAGLGGGAGVLFAIWANSRLGRFKPMMPGYMEFDVHFDWTAVAFAVALTMLTGLLFGLAPALHATREGIAPALKTGLPVRVRGYRWFSLRNVLVLQQVACSLALLLLTGFMVLGFYRFSSVELGFDARHVHLVTLDPVRDGYSPARAAEFFARLPERVRRIPGVTAASLSQSAPMIAEQVVVTKPESDRDPKAVRTVSGERVGARYFETLRIPILTGRDFRETDQKDDSRVAIVNQMLARQLWPGQDAVGRRLESEGTVYEIIGVARDVRSTLLVVPTQPCVYRPMLPSGFSRPPREGVTLLVRAEPGVDAPVQLRRDLAAIDPNVTVFKVSTMTDEVNQMLYLVRASTTVYGAAGLFGLILAAVGLAGVTAQAVARRSHEIGIRIALGAGRGDVLRLVLREGAVLVIIGTVIGQVAAFAMIRVLRTVLAALAELTRVSASDPLLLIGASLLLATVAMLACYLPARRSARIDPAAALRAE